MRILFLLPFVRNKVEFACLYKEKTFDNPVDATQVVSATSVELPKLLPPDAKVREQPYHNIGLRNYVLAEETLELCLEPVHACDAELADAQDAIAKYLGAGWNFYQHPSHDWDASEWEPRFVDAAGGAGGLSPEVLQEMAGALFSGALFDGIRKIAKKAAKKGKKGKKD